MKYLFTLFLIVLSCRSLAQQSLTYKQLMDSGRVYTNKNNKQYQKALNKFNAAKLLDPSRAVEVDKEISLVFDAIEQEKNEAKLQRDKAQAALKLAEEKTNDATALFWASESEKLIPMQGMRLLNKAYLKTQDSNALAIIREKTENNFNGSYTHQYVGISLFQDISSIDFTSDSKWLVTENNDGTYKLWQLPDGKQYNFLQSEKTSAL